MNTDTAQKLVELNRDFYTRFGAEFSATRRRLQPGVRRVLDSLRGDEALLDVGCGNGEAARELNRRGFGGSYIGVDFSPPLLKDAAANYSFSVTFQQADLTSRGWAHPLRGKCFDAVCAFAVLHHIPSVNIRLDLLQAMKDLLKPEGRLILSNWQFLNSEKLRARIQPWGLVSLRGEDLDKGDYLLDWRSGGSGLRYAHHFSTEELADLAQQLGMRISAEFLSDGEGGNLGLYQIWERG